MLFLLFGTMGLACHPLTNRACLKDSTDQRTVKRSANVERDWGWQSSNQLLKDMEAMWGYKANSEVAVLSLSLYQYGNQDRRPDWRKIKRERSKNRSLLYFNLDTHSTLQKQPVEKRSIASMAATAAILTISRTSAPRCKTWMGAPVPSNIGPIVVAPPRRLSSL